MKSLPKETVSDIIELIVPVALADDLRINEREIWTILQEAARDNGKLPDHRRHDLTDCIVLDRALRRVLEFYGERDPKLEEEPDEGAAEEQAERMDHDTRTLDEVMSYIRAVKDREERNIHNSKTTGDSRDKDLIAYQRGFNLLEEVLDVIAAMRTPDALAHSPDCRVFIVGECSCGLSDTRE